MRLYETRTIKELAGMFENIKPLPEQQQKGSLYIYSAKDRKLSDDIARAIQWKMDDERRALQGGKDGET